MKHIQWLWILYCFVIPSFCGCFGVKKPEGIPDLTPCTITLTQQGNPAEKVHVTLVPVNQGLEKWPSSGITDASGTTKLVTYSQYRGVPEGDYKIVLGKIVSEGGENDDETTPLSKRKAIKIYSFVDEKYTKEDTTPLNLKVEKKKINVSFEIGPPTRKLIETIRPGISKY